MIVYILIAIISYLLGSLSFSIMLSRQLPKGDVRTHGSGNAGATNMARVYGLKHAFITLGGDMLKCFAAMFISLIVAGEIGMAVSGIACITGHCYPAFYNFKGGKGVSVGGAMALLVDWRVGLAVIAIFIVIAFSTKKVSLGSCSGAVMIFAASLFFGLSVPMLILSGYSMCLVIFKHRENLKRVINGTEPDFKPAKTKK